ncbi:MAG: acetate--CoA ligase alpha subunit [Chloroflexota bacterium]
MLDPTFFSPNSVAVIGASPDQEKLGYIVLKNILQYKYQGDVYPVNPHAAEIMGLQSYSSVTDIPGTVEMAIIVVPARIVPEVINQCGEKGVKGAVIISAGFKETGPEGLHLENEIRARARQHHIRLLGPNCLGFIDTAKSLNASFASGMAKKGNIAFMSQSGAICQAILDWSKGSGIGFSRFVSLGNKADINESDLIESWKDDENTAVVIAYLEGITEGDRFRKAAAAITRIKPLIIVKAGSTQAGSRAASSHTGTLAGFDAAYNAIFRQTGILRVSSMEEMVDFAFAFAEQPLIQGDRIAIVTNAGGPGIMASDACERAGLKLSQFTNETVENLRSSLPPTASYYNPVDVIGDAGPDRYESAMRIVLKDPNVDGALILLTPQAVTDVAKTADIIIAAAEKSEKPVLASFMGGPAVAPGIKKLTRHHVPNYPYPERAVESLKAMNQQRNWLQKKTEDPITFPVDKKTARAILKQARERQRQLLSDIEARQIIEAYGMALPKSQLAHSAKEAAAFADKIGYPVVMKIASPDILHKTDIGGVKVGLASPEVVRSAYLEIMENAHHLLPQAQILGVDIQALVKGREVILGMNCDAQFGPLLMFGLGGIYVEVLKDVSFRVAPISPQDALDMIQDIKGYPLLTGVRGEKPADIDAIVNSLLRLSQMVIDFPEIMELDINPFIVGNAGKGAVAIDCRMRISIPAPV